ncbi:MAG: hypothetical protein RMY00_19600 [Nostoc sp. ChiVER01]|nr:hypothetical protein [Nostoc sp. ChiVER01]
MSYWKNKLSVILCCDVGTQANLQEQAIAYGTALRAIALTIINWFGALLR